MTNFKRQILLTSCLVFLLPHFGVASENEHERYVPKQILENAKSKLEAQAKALGIEDNISHMGEVTENTTAHIDEVDNKSIKKVRKVGPFFDFEKAAGIKPPSMKFELDDQKKHTDGDVLSAKTAIMDGDHNTPIMHEGFDEKAPKDVHNDGHDAVAENEHIVGQDLETGKDEHHKDVNRMVGSTGQSHDQNDSHVPSKTHEIDVTPKGNYTHAAGSHTTEMHETSVKVEHAADEHLGKHEEGAHEPEMFKSVFDEQDENMDAHGKVNDHANDGDTDDHAEKAKDDHGEEGDHVEPEIVFEIVEVPRGLDEPTRQIRALQRLQDGLVSGVPDASKRYRMQLMSSSKELKMVEDETWQYKKNLDAVALFTLIGGNPRIGKIARSKTKLSADHSLYLDAALAYSEGRLGKAYVLFKKINFKHVPISTAAQFAIVKSMLFGRADAKAAKDYLNLARKIAPGTLAEEASLRRLIRMSSDDKDVKLFMRISRIYISRFKNSFYFNDFLKNYAYSLVRMPKSSQEQILDSMRHIFKSLKDNQQLAVASYVSGITTDTGMFKLSAWTSKRALDLSRVNGKLHTRMKLYHLASTVTQPGAEDTMLDMIEGINDDVLNAKDKQLYNSVIALSHRLYNDPMTQEQIKSGIKTEVQRYSKDDPTKKLFDESAVYARNNVTIKKSIDILANSVEVLRGSSL